MPFIIKGIDCSSDCADFAITVFYKVAAVVDFAVADIDLFAARCN